MTERDMMSQETATMIATDMKQLLYSMEDAIRLQVRALLGERKTSFNIAYNRNEFFTFSTNKVLSILKKMCKVYI